jgi:hypothetical protein
MLEANVHNVTADFGLTGRSLLRPEYSCDGI